VDYWAREGTAVKLGFGILKGDRRIGFGCTKALDSEEYSGAVLGLRPPTVGRVLCVR
jgi:hypothetical protein